MSVILDNIDAEVGAKRTGTLLDAYRETHGKRKRGHPKYCQRNQPSISTKARRVTQRGTRPEGMEKTRDRLQCSWLMMVIMRVTTQLLNRLLGLARKAIDPNKHTTERIELRSIDPMKLKVLESCMVSR